MAKRLLCVVLSLLMIMSILPAGVVAEGSTGLLTSGAVTAGTYSLTSNVTLTGTLTISEAVTIDLCGYTITGFGSSNVFKINNGGSLTINDTVGTGVINGNGKIIVYVQMYDDDYDGASFILNGGTLTGGSGNDGGGVYIETAGGSITFTMNGGEITNCSATDGRGGGGAVNICGFNAVTFTMNGGSITGNSAISSDSNCAGGAVYIDNSQAVFTMNNGTITGNKASKSSGGVYVYNGSFVMNGGTLSTNYILGIDSFNELQSLATSSNSTASASVVAGTVCSTCLSYVPEGTTKTENSDGTYTIGEAVATDCVASAYNSAGELIASYETVAEAIEAVSSEGTVVLLKDVSESIAVDYTKTLTLDLAGYTLTGSISITGGNLTLKDSSTDGAGTVTGGVTVDAKVVFNGTYFLMNDGSYKSENELGGDYSNINTDYMGIGLAGTGSFTMNGGTISGNNTATNGGGVNISNGGVGNLFTVTYDDNGNINSIVSSNSSSYINTFVMNGGTISGNTASSQGGGVFVGSYCTFTMNGGVITGNKASTGGGVYVSSDATFTMASSSAIYGNEASEEGADLYSYSTSITLISPSAMSATGMDFAGYDWYYDTSDARFSENVTDTFDASNWKAEYVALIAAKTVATPTLYGRTLTLDGAIGVTFYFDMGDLTPSDYTMTAVIDEGGAETRTIKGITVSDTTKEIDGTTYYRYTVYLTSVELTSEIKATLYCGTTNVGTYTYSASTYCSRAIEGNWDEKELCEYLMYYYNCATHYFDAETGAITGNAEYNISSHDPSWSVSEWSNDNVSDAISATGDMPTVLGNTEPSVTLDLQSQIIMRLYLSASDISGLTVTVNGDDASIESDSSQDGFNYSVAVSIPAKNLSDSYVFVISDGTNEYTVTYSVYNYIYSIVTTSNPYNESTDETHYVWYNRLSDLCKAIYYYSEASAKYTLWF